MRRRTITLVVVGLVLALFVLPAAAKALVLADEPVVVDDEAEPVYTIDPTYDPDSMYLLFGFIEDDGDDPCEGVAVVPDPADPGEVTFTVDGAEGELPADCVAVDVAGPNDQANHGQVQSSFVEALKGIHNKDIHGPFGQFVKTVAGSDFGKEDPDGIGTLDISTLDIDADDDGDGPPAHANENSKKPKKNK